MSGYSETRTLSKIHPVSRETLGRLSSYVDLLVQWQQKTNLIASSTVEQIWDRHVADSLQVLALKPDCRKWLDLGSGGGFPGLVIAAAMADQKDASVTLVESNQKKAAFLRQANRKMDAGAKIHNGRIEDFAGQGIEVSVVTARALATLPLLLELAYPWMAKGAVALFHKGRDFERELEECDGLWNFDLVHHQSLISADSAILEISNLQRV